MTLDENDIETKLTERFARHAQDFDDLQNEMAGRDVGRISRFLGADAKEAKGGEKREERKAAMLSGLQAALADPAYAALFEETQTVLSDAQTRLDALLERINIAIEQTQASLADKMDRAASLPDGTKVFRDKNGDVVARDGTIIAAELAATIIWRGDEPSLEDVQADEERLERLNEIKSDARAGQARIGEMQAAMEDEFHAESSDELEGFKNEANDAVDGLEGRFEAEMNVVQSAPKTDGAETAHTAELAVPEL